MGETTTRFASRMPRKSNGANIGGAGRSRKAGASNRSAALDENQVSICSMKSLSRILRFSYVMALERDIRLNVNWAGSVFQ